MRSVLSLACLFFIAGFSIVVDTALGEVPATQEAVKSVKTLESAPAQEDTRRGVSKTPSVEKEDVALSAREPATAGEPEKTPVVSPEKGKEAALEVPEEAERQPAGRSSVKKDRSPESKPEAEEGGRELYSVEEGERARDERASIHKMVSENTKEGTLFSVEEAEKAGEEQTSIHEMVSKEAKEAVSLFSVEEAERVTEREAAPPRREEVEPAVTERRDEEAEKQERKKVAISRRKPKEKEDWVKIELGFAYKNIQLYQGSYTFETHFIGEMLNDTGRNFGIVKFMFSTYDRRGKLISEEPFQITDFYSGQMKTFNGTVVDGYKDIANHKIRFISAAPTSRG